MASLTDEQRETLSSLFMMSDFRSMFAIINQEYMNLQFQDKLTDTERIAEYKYITQQLRKYMSGRQDAIFACGSDLEKMRNIVTEWLNNAPEYGNERKDIVYNFLRDGWLVELYNGLSYLIDQTQETEEDE